LLIIDNRNRGLSPPSQKCSAFLGRQKSTIFEREGRSIASLISEFANRANQKSLKGFLVLQMDTPFAIIHGLKSVVFASLRK